MTGTSFAMELPDGDTTHSKLVPVSQVVRALEKLKYFKRIPHPNDTRAKIITLSATGRKVAANAIKVVEAPDHAFFEVLGNETDFIVQLFQKLLE
jgi:DNA-binding MarR family transcriptional regulator